MYNYEQQTIHLIKRTLREKAIRKVNSRHSYIIDSGYSLRVMLEFYRTERRNRFKLLKEAFDNNNYAMSFKNFRKIIHLNFPHVCEVEIATLYRESFVYSNSSEHGATMESFFTSATDLGFFIK